MFRTPHASCLSAFILSLLVAESAAQSPPQIAVAPHDAQIAQRFTFVASMRELPDGRVLLTDQIERRLAVADFRNGMVTDVSRRGEGPTEFRSPGSLFALGADTTIMTDVSSRTWLVLLGDRVVAKWTMSNSIAVRAAGSELVDGVDRMGHVVRAVHPPRDIIFSPPFDSIWVVRYDRSTGAGDTLTRGMWLRSGYYAMLASGNTASRSGGGVAGQQSQPSDSYSVASHLREVDAIAAYPDGWIAVARFSPYRVDWCAPTAKNCTEGPVIEQPRPYDDAEKRAFLDMFGAKQTIPATELSRVRGWPPAIPPFVQRNRKAIRTQALRPMPDGRLLIERVESLKTPANTYDIVDRRGALVGRVKLPGNQRIVGFGVNSLYTAVTDADDLERLYRHPWR